MKGKTQELLLSLIRQSPTEHWGFSLVGGADVNTPLIVTRVSLRFDLLIKLKKSGTFCFVFKTNYFYYTFRWLLAHLLMALYTGVILLRKLVVTMRGISDTKMRKIYLTTLEVT